MDDTRRKRPARRSLVRACAVVAALTIAFTIGVAQAADQRLDEADLALQKAAALLEASQPGGVSEKAQRKFERHVDRALQDVAQAREQIDAAKDAVDSP